MTIEHSASGEWRIDRRTVLRGAAATTLGSVFGLSAMTGSALAERHIETCGLLDIVCAIDTSGSLSATEVANLEAGVNGFIEMLPTDGSVTVGTLEFGNNGVRNRNPLQNPSGFSVSVSNPSGNTPMPGALDIADQALYGDGAARTNAMKLVVLFTDGGPNYTNTSYTAGYTAPRNSSANWSATAGNSIYDNADVASATVSKGEMDETALVASSVKDGTIGGGATMIATVYVGDNDTEAMTADAISAYTNLPTFLSSHVATSSDYAINVDSAEVEELVERLVALLEELCCDPCRDDLYVKFEWTEAETEGPCSGHFVLYDADDTMLESVDGIELVSVTCDEDGEPQEACFETTYCTLDAAVKAGRDTEHHTISFDETGGRFCLHGITSTKGPEGKEKEVTHAISNVVFTCPDAGE